jgi:hypothetical protein
LPNITTWLDLLLLQLLLLQGCRFPMLLCLNLLLLLSTAKFCCYFLL